MKKIFAIILALAMTFALSATALAATAPTTGTVTVKFIKTDGEFATANDSFNGKTVTLTKEGSDNKTANIGEGDIATFTDVAPGEWTITPPENIAATGSELCCNPSTQKVTVVAGQTVAAIYNLHKAKDAYGNDEKGSITVSNPAENQNYCIYRMFDVVSYITGGSISYKVVAEWASFFAAPSTDSATDAGPGYAYIHLDSNGQPTWVKTYDDDDDEGTPEVLDDRFETVEAFAQAAKAWATTNNISSQQCIKNCAAENPNYYDNPQTLKFTCLPYGYYLVDSTVGVFCALDTANPDAVIMNKIGEPTPEKKATGDAADGSVAVGDTVNYEVTITDIAGVVDLIFYDQMSASLELDTTSVKVYYVANGETTETDITSDANKCSVDTTAGTNPFDYRFKVTFVDDWTKTLEPGDKIIIRYSAKVVNATDITNKAIVTFGQDGGTSDDEEKIYTYGFNVIKHKENENGETLGGAKFRLKKTVGEGANAKVYVAYWEKVGDNYVFRGWTEDDADNPPTTVPAENVPANHTYTYDLVSAEADGAIHVTGLDEGTYVLTETEAPAGFNRAADVTVEITATEVDGKATGEYTVKFNNVANDDKTVDIADKSGGTLPGVGGIGTTIFYIIGGLLMVGAAVLLVVRKKMSVTE